MNHTNLLDETEVTRCSCHPNTKIQFLETSCSIENGRNILDLYKKPTDRNQYSLTNSIHPAHCHENIPFSLAMRINRICIKPDTRNKRLQKLKVMLLEREYRSGMIDSAIEKVRAIPRKQAVNFTSRNPSNKRPVYVASFDPRLPNIQTITMKHGRSMKRMDPHLAEVFPEPPLIAYKRQANIREKIIRAKLNRPSNQPRRFQPGMKKCLKQFCGSCPYIREEKEIKHKNGKWKILKEVNCETTNCIYLIECRKELDGVAPLMTDPPPTNFNPFKKK